MNEEEFLKEIKKLNFDFMKDGVLQIPFCYTIDEDNNIVIDIEGMQEDVEYKIDKINGILE